MAAELQYSPAVAEKILAPARSQRIEVIVEIQILLI
jgi:hypothetical protein